PEQGRFSTQPPHVALRDSGPSFCPGADVCIESRPFSGGGTETAEPVPSCLMSRRSGERQRRGRAGRSALQGRVQAIPIESRPLTERYRSGHNGTDSKSVEGITSLRGFESHPLRHSKAPFGAFCVS